MHSTRRVRGDFQSRSSNSKVPYYLKRKKKESADKHVSTCTWRRWKVPITALKGPKQETRGFYKKKIINFACATYSQAEMCTY